METTSSQCCSAVKGSGSAHTGNYLAAVIHQSNFHHKIQTDKGLSWPSHCSQTSSVYIRRSKTPEWDLEDSRQSRGRLWPETHAGPSDMDSQSRDSCQSKSTAQSVSTWNCIHKYIYWRLWWRMKGDFYILPVSHHPSTGQISSATAWKKGWQKVSNKEVHLATKSLIKCHYQ